MIDASDLQAARVAKKSFQEHVRGINGITGIGIGKADDGRYEVQVFLSVPAAGVGLPKVWLGIPVHPQVTGRIRAR